MKPETAQKKTAQTSVDRTAGRGARSSDIFWRSRRCFAKQ